MEYTSEHPDTLPQTADHPSQASSGPSPFAANRAAGAYQRVYSSGNRHKRSAGSREAKLKSKLLAARLIAIGAIVAATVLAMLWIRAHYARERADVESRNLAIELNQTKQELEQAKRLLAAHDVELGAIMRQRIPGVQPLEIDTLYDIDQRYLKKLSFTESGVGADKRLTYYAVLKNAGDTPIRPAAQIHLFDQNGLQIGLGKIAVRAATTGSEPELQPGETRTYSAPIEAVRAGEPRYFLVELM